MTEITKTSDSAQEFLSSIERLVAPVYTECFSDETRKTRNLLLIISFVLILSSLGLVAFGREPVKVPMLEISVTITSGIRWVLVTLCGYFLVLHSARSYTEWNLWRLRHQAPAMGISDLGALISSQLAERTASIYAAWTTRSELNEKLIELQRDPPELIDAIRRRDVLYKECLRLDENVRMQENQLQSREFEDELFKVNQMREEFFRIDQEVERQRDEHRARIAEEHDSLQRQLKDADEIISTKVAAPDRKALIARQNYLAGATQPVSWILKTRFVFEILFPTAFAVAAMLIGVFAS